MSEAQGTYDCPICTDGFPHQHSQDKWIGVDFDGTLAFSIERTSPYELGPPVPEMVNRVRSWLAHGLTVKLFTARMCEISKTTGQVRDLVFMEAELRRWCREHIGSELECVNAKDGLMEVLWDDRAVRVVRDTGRPK